MNLKKWYLENLIQELGEQWKIHYNIAEIQILRKTPNAIHVELSSEYGVTRHWIPLSCIMTEKESVVQYKKDEEPLDKYYELIEWAKTKKVLGIRKKMKKTTVLLKIKAAGLISEVPKELL